LELGHLERKDDVIWLSKAAAPYNNVLPMLFSPDSFKEDLLLLPEEYLSVMPTPLVLTRLGATQSAPIDMQSSAEHAVTFTEFHERGPSVYPAGSCPVVSANGEE
jgi:hypothetical protein